MSDTSYVQNGDILDHVLAADTPAGTLIFKGPLCLQIVTGAKAGHLVGARQQGVIRLKKATATVLDPDVAAVVHWNNTTKLAVAAAADGQVGRAVAGGNNGDDFVDVLLNA